MSRRVKQQRQRERERERGGGSVCTCVPLNLSSLHTLRPCVRSGTRAEPERTGVRELEAWPVAVGAEPTRGEGPRAAPGRVSRLLELKWRPGFAIMYSFINLFIFLRATPRESIHPIYQKLHLNRLLLSNSVSLKCKTLTCDYAAKKDKGYSHVYSSVSIPRKLQVQKCRT